MGICPQCGSFVDEGEPYCPYCSYYPSSTSEDDDNSIEIGGKSYDRDEVEDALRENGYDLDDLKRDLIDEDELEDILYWL
ncbi:hypothetical protein [Methanobrevibacter sp.]|uniref:hypothetical protein n=1 Tax=Methanobrevibacter sp. TaxID=66852 RepID=UPI003865819D